MINSLQRCFLFEDEFSAFKINFQSVTLVWRAHWMARAHLVTEVTQREHLVSEIVPSAAT